MTNFRYRPILGFLSITISALVSFFLIKFSAAQNIHPTLSSDLLFTTLHGFNVSILFSWAAFGLLGGVLVTVLAFLIGLWAILRAGLYHYSFLTLPFIVTNIIGYIYSRRRDKLEQIYNLKSEKLEEEINIFSNNIKEKKSAILSLDEKLERYSILKDVVEELSVALSADDINNLIIEKAYETIKKGGRVLLFLVDTEKQELMLTASKNTSRVKAKKGDLFDHWVLRHRKPLIIEDAAADFRFPADEVEKEKGVFRSLITVPLVNEDKVVGILRMDNPKELIYTQDDLRLLDILADLGVVAIQNAILYSQTQELAIHDGLTGLFVRRYFMERFSEEVKRAARSKGTFSLMMIDIDNFKDYNDKYGHTAGDLVLKHLSQAINSKIKEGDMLARYGGEELVLFLVGVNKESAAGYAESIRKMAENNPIMLRRKESRVTVSIGVSNYPKDSILKDELIKIADNRLYKAKNSGRNRVCADTL